jgi:hypothetical protein
MPNPTRFGNALPPKATKQQTFRKSRVVPTTDSRRAANKFHHSITSSARAKRVGGIANPSAFADDTAVEHDAQWRIARAEAVARERFAPSFVVANLLRRAFDSVDAEGRVFVADSLRITLPVVRKRP